MTTCLPTKRMPIKKRRPHPPCGHLSPTPRQVRATVPETDTRTIDQAVGGEADPNSRVFSIGPFSALPANTDLGAVRLGLLIG